MKRKRILQTIENINPKYIEEAMEYEGKKKALQKKLWYKRIAVAACFAIIFSLGTGIMLKQLLENDHEMLGIYMEDREPIIATIEELRDEGLMCSIVYPDIHKFITKGYSVLILFHEGIKISTLDGSEFQYDSESPNAKDCGLPVGTVIKVYFTDVNYKSDGMAHSLGAEEIILYNPE